MYKRALKLYLHEMFGPLCWTMFGLVLVVATWWLSQIARGLQASFGDLLYGFLLGIITSLFGFALHYLRHRRFLELAELKITQVHKATDIESLLSLANSPEQQFFMSLMRTYMLHASEEVRQLEEKRAFYETFTTRFAHQMKTPLTVLHLLVQELKVKPEVHIAFRELKDTIAAMEVEQARIEHALEMMLYTARLQSFSFDARMATLDVVQLLRSLVNEHKSAWIRAQIYPQIEAPSQAIVHSDEKWIRFICEQFVRNALQYGYAVDIAGEPTDEATTFQITVCEDANSTHVKFIDRGIGMTVRDQRRIFEPFFTGENGRLHSRATGMGLYLAAEVSKQLGVQLNVTSRLHHGTTMELTIPKATYISPYLKGNEM